MKTPKTLRVSREHDVFVKKLKIGDVRKHPEGWIFRNYHPDAPKDFTAETVSAIKQQLTVKIDRNTYMKLVDASPE